MGIVKKCGPLSENSWPSWCPKLVTGLMLTPLQLPSVYHNPVCDGCAHDAKENRMREKNLVDKMYVRKDLASSIPFNKVKNQQCKPPFTVSRMK